MIYLAPAIQQCSDLLAGKLNCQKVIHEPLKHGHFLKIFILYVVEVLPF